MSPILRLQNNGTFCYHLVNNTALGWHWPAAMYCLQTGSLSIWKERSGVLSPYCLDPWGPYSKKPATWQTAYDRKMWKGHLTCSFNWSSWILNEIKMELNHIFFCCYEKRQWHVCMTIHIKCVCVWFIACLHIHVSAAASCNICTCLLLCTLSDYCSPRC